MNWPVLAVWSLASVLGTCFLGSLLRPFPRIRAAVCIAGLLTCFLPFAPSLPSKAAPVNPQQSVAATSANSAEKSPIGDIGEGASQATPAHKADLSPWLGWFWCLGAGFMGVRLALSVRTMNRVRQVESPMVVGFPRSRILVPDPWPSDLSEIEIQAALSHENAHLHGRHVTLIVLTSAVSAWLWWTPSWFVLRMLDDALEDIADSKSLESVPDGLATGLLKLAVFNHPAHLRMGATSAAKRLERRIRRIKGKAAMEKPIAAALAATVIVSAAFAIAPRLSFRNDNFGLVQGATWTYRKTYTDGTAETLNRSISKVFPKGDETAYELKELSDSGAMELTYMAHSNASGLYTRPGRGMNGNGPGFFEDQSTVLVPAVTKTGTSWRYVLPFRGQTLGDVDTASLAVTVNAEIVDADASVKVPAGTFRAIHVRESYRQSKPASQPWSSDLWYSPAVGLVKRVEGQRGQVGFNETVLTRYSTPAP